MNTPTTWLAISPGEMAGLLIPMMVFAIPIVAILTAHQRKMAELMREQSSQNQQGMLGTPDIQSIRSEIYELKDLVRQQTILIDDLSVAQRALQTRIQQSDQNQTSSTL